MVTLSKKERKKNQRSTKNYFSSSSIYLRISDFQIPGFLPVRKKWKTLLAGDRRWRISLGRRKRRWLNLYLPTYEIYSRFVKPTTKSVLTITVFIIPVFRALRLLRFSHVRNNPFSPLLLLLQRPPPLSRPFRRRILVEELSST